MDSLNFQNSSLLLKIARHEKLPYQIGNDFAKMKRYPIGNCKSCVVIGLPCAALCGHMAQIKAFKIVTR